MQSSSEQFPATNLSDVLAGIWQRKLLLLALPLLGVLGGELFLMSSKPTYLAEAQVIIENMSTPFDRANSVPEQGVSDQVTDKMVQSQVSVMKSRDIAARVVDQLSLDAKPEYNSRLRTSGFLGQLAVALGFKDDPQLYAPKDLAAKNLSSGITVYPVPETNVIGIKSVSTNAGLAAATANAVAQTYVLSTHEVGATSNDRVRAWMSHQIDDLRAKVSTADNAVEKYRAEAGLLKGTSSTLGTQQISELNSQITLAESAAAEAQAKADEIRHLFATRGTVDASADVLSNVLVQNLRGQQVAAERKVSEISATYLPNHPKMIAAVKELNSVNAQVRNEALRVADGLQGQAKIAAQRAATLRADLTKQKGTQASANESDVKLQALQRDADASRTLLQTMLNRYADANARQDANQQPGFSRIIQSATVPPSIYFPKAGPVLILSTLAGLVMGFGLAFVLELLRAPAVSAPQSQRAVRPHPLAGQNGAAFAVPSIEPERTQEAFVPGAVAPATKPQNKEQHAVSFASVPGAVTASGLLVMAEQLNKSEGGKVAETAKHLANTLVNLKSKEGVSTHAYATLGSPVPNGALATIATARELASRGAKVIVLELSIGLTGVETLTGVGPGPGLIELVDGTSDFTRVVSRDPSSNIHLIRIGNQPTAEKMLVVAEKLNRILEALRTIYEHVLLHVGEASVATVPFLSAADIAIILAPSSRLADAQTAARALSEQGNTKCLLVKLELEGATQPTAAVSA